MATTNQLSRDTDDSGCYTPASGSVTGPFPFCDFPDAQGFQGDTTRLSFGYQAEAQAASRHLLTAGVDVEHETGEIGSRGRRAACSPRARTRASTSRTAW